MSGQNRPSDLSLFIGSSCFAFFLAAAVTLAILAYGFFEAREVRIERVRLASPKFPPSVGLVRAVQISEVHIGLLVRGERLKKILEKVREADGGDDNRAGPCRGRGEHVVSLHFPPVGNHFFQVLFPALSRTVQPVSLTIRV